MTNSNWHFTQIQNSGDHRSALWDITGTCNLRCKHCYQYDRYNYHQSGPYQYDLSKEQVKTALERLMESAITHIHFLGGEPLLRQDFDEILTEVKSKDIYVSINTNGMALTERRMKELLAAGVDQIMVSIDGATADTNDSIRGKGTFETVWRNLCHSVAMTRDTNMLIGIAFTATSTNVHELPDLLNNAFQVGIEYVHIVPVDEAGNFVRNKDMLGDDEILLISWLEKALQAHGSKLVGRMKIRTDLRFWPMEVLNRKYGNILEPDPTGIKCQGGKKFMVIQADGRFGACSAALDKNFSKSVVERGYLTVEPELIHLLEPKTLDLSEGLQDFYRFQKAPETFANLTPCDRCRFRDICQPCPIEYADQKRIDQCIWAEKEEQRQRQQFLFNALVPAASFFLKDGCLIYLEKGIELPIGRMLEIIIRAASQCGLEDGIDSLPFEPPLTGDQKEEIIRTLEQLKVYGTLESRSLKEEVSRGR